MNLQTQKAIIIEQFKQVDDINLIKDPSMLKRLNEIISLPEKDKDNILYALDGLLRDAKARQAYSA